MKAVVMTSVGGPEVLQYQDAADPVIRRDTEILVRLKAARCQSARYQTAE